MEYQWDTVTEEELKHLYYEEGMTDREIAERFGVSMGKVAYKRRKYGISIKIWYTSSLWMKIRSCLHS